MGLFTQDKRITISGSFTNKYKLVITSDIQTGSMPMQTKAEIRWEVKCDYISEEEISIEIITLSNQLVESNNPMIRDIANMNQIFAKMYSELYLIIDNKGKIKDVKKLDLIKQKWNWIKKEIIEIQEQEPMIKHVINLNEEQLSNEQILIQAIQNNEFFQIYFYHLFGNKERGVTKIVQQKNILNTSVLNWTYRIDKKEETLSNFETFNIEGFLETPIPKLKESYKIFSHLEIEKLKPQLTENGTYLLDKKNGRIIKATLRKQEIVHPQLMHATINYDLAIE